MALDLSKYGATPIAAPPDAAGAPAQPNVAQRIWHDVANRAQGNVDIYNTQVASGDTSLPAVVSSGTKLVGNTFGGIGDTIGELIKTVPGGSQALDAIGGAGSTAFKAVTDKLASTELFKNAANHPEATKTLEQLLSTGQSLGDIANNILAAEGGRSTAVKAADLTTKVLDKVPATPITPPTAASDKVVTSLTKEWQKPADTNLPAFNKARQVIEQSPDTPKFLSEQGIDPTAHIEDGRYATADTADSLRATAGKLSRDGLRPSLQHADYSTSKTAVTDIQQQAAERAASTFGVTPADAESVKSSINTELEALQKKYPEGMSLTDMHDEGITYNQNGGYKPFASAADTNKAIASRAIGSTLKTLVEKKAPTDLPVGEYNNYLSKYYKAADYLDAINSKKAPVSFVQGLTRGAFKFGGAALAEHLAPGVVSAFAGYQIGKAIEHAIENLPNPLRARFIANLEITQPAAAKALQEYLAKTARGGGMAQLPAPSAIIPPAPSEATQMAGRASELAPK